MRTAIINPAQLVRPRGYNHGIKISGASALFFLGGQVGWDSEGCLVAKDSIALQFDQALKNILAVVQEAGGGAENIVKLNLYVTDKEAYLAALKEMGESYRRYMGKHFPAMTLVEVKSLYEAGVTSRVRSCVNTLVRRLYDYQVSL